MKAVELAVPVVLLGTILILLSVAVSRGSQAPISPQQILASDGVASDQFGYSVAVSGDAAVVGAILGSNRSDERVGAAYVFGRPALDWTDEEKVFAEDGEPSDAFGWSVALAGDSVVVGSIFGSDGRDPTGSTSVFVRDRDDWAEQVELLPRDGESGDRFGHAVAISDDTVVIGSPMSSTPELQRGSAYIFVRSSSGRWSLQDKLRAVDGDSLNQFGYAVSISGDTAVIGAPWADDRGDVVGAAYVFVRNGTRWGLEAKLMARDGAVGDAFGFAVSVEGDTAVIGAPFSDPNGNSSGSAYVFVRDGDEWVVHSTLQPRNAAAGDNFGISLSISGSYLAIGAPQTDFVGTEPGSAHLFVRTHEEWIEREQLLPEAAATDLSFGQSVSVSGNTVLVGAPGAAVNGLDSGAAYAFTVDYIFTLTVTPIGTGSGSVSSSPPGIQCGPDCTEDYPVDTEITLTPTPATGSIFAGWGGDADCDDGEITMTDDLTCTAWFSELSSDIFDDGFESGDTSSWTESEP